MHSVLFVCTANICRSPMAMAIFESMVKGDRDEWRVASAGTWAVEGMPVAPKTQLVLKNKDLDLSSYSSRRVNDDLINSFNLILTMEQGHKEALVVEFPEASKRIFLLSEMIGLKYDIPDPIGRSEADFQVTYNEIEQTLRLGFEKIRRLAR